MFLASKWQYLSVSLPSANILKDQTILTPSSIFLISLALFYIITAIMHPQEIGLVCFGLLYIICIPAAGYFEHGQHEQHVLGHPGDGACCGHNQSRIPQTKAQKGR